MKKQDETTKLNIENFFKRQNENNYIKTTNVNILLNRVRLDKKRDFRKKFLLALILVSSISALILYLNI